MVTVYDHCGHQALKNGTLGLSLAWLASSPDPDKESHDLQKVVLSDASSFQVRQHAWRDITIQAAERGGVWQAIVETEKRERNGTCEVPTSIPCQAYRAR